MSQSLAAERYGTALFEAACDSEALSEVERDLQLIREILAESPEFCAMLQDPLADEGQLEALVHRGFLGWVHDVTRRFLELLVQNRRLGVLEMVPAVFDRNCDVHRNILDVQLETARALPEAALDRIRRHMEQRTGKTVRLHQQIVPHLRAGFRMFYEDRMVDCSASGHLKRLRDRLMKAS